MMKISYISTYPPTPCGIGSYTSYLSRALLRIDQEIEVSVIAEKGAGRIKTERFETAPCFRRKEGYVKKIMETLARFSPDIVHIQHEFAIFNPDERFLNLLGEIKRKAEVVITFHTVHTDETSDWEGMSMSMEEYNRRMSRLVNGIIVHQDSMRENLCRQGIDEKLIYVIPHGTEILKRVSKVEARRRLELPEDGKVILSFGFFSRYKNRNLIIQALPYLLEEVPDVYIFFSGYPRKQLREDFELQRFCKRKVEELGMENRVIFTKRFIPDEKVHLVFSSSDVVVFPYLQRYFSASGSLHLAMGAFKPVVVSKIPKFEEVVREISEEVVFKPNNFYELARILMRLMTDDGFRESIVRKVKNYAFRTSWDVVAKEHLQVYRSLYLTHLPEVKSHLYFSPQ